MLISKTVWSKTILLVLILIFSFQVPVQASSESQTTYCQTFGKVILDHPKVLFGVAVVGLALAAISDAYLNYQEAVARQNEEKIYIPKLRNVQEQWAAQHAVEEAAERGRIDEAQGRYAQEKLIFQQKYAADTAQKLEEMRVLEEKKKAELQAAFERLSEELRIQAENQMAEEERINALDAEQFSEFISSRMGEIEHSVNEVIESPVMQSIYEVQGLITLLSDDVVDFYVVREEALNNFQKFVGEKLAIAQTLKSYLERRMGNTHDPALEQLKEKFDVLYGKTRDLSNTIYGALRRAHAPAGKASISARELLGGALLLSRIFS